jgi:hypothetical protein
VSLLDQPPLQLAEARGRLGDLRYRAGQRAALSAALVLIGTAFAVVGQDAVGVPILIGAGAGALLVALARNERRRLLVRLVAQDDAWSIEEVKRAASRLLSAAERRRLSRGLVRAAEAAVPRGAQFSVVAPWQAASAELRLRRLAALIDDQAVPLRAAGAALCRRFLSDAFLSPLYNPNLPEPDLERTLAVIERAIRAPRCSRS